MECRINAGGMRGSQRAAGGFRFSRCASFHSPQGRPRRQRKTRMAPTRCTPSSPPADLPRALGVRLSPPATALSPPTPTTPTSSSTRTEYTDVFAGVGMHPPTPAPSPDPHARTFDHGDAHHVEQVVHHDTQPAPHAIVAQYTALPPLRRSQFLSLLVPHLTLHEALSLSRKIEPLLRRDFLRELPWEVALHVLSFASLSYV